MISDRFHQALKAAMKKDEKRPLNRDEWGAIQEAMNGGADLISIFTCLHAASLMPYQGYNQFVEALAGYQSTLNEFHVGVPSVYEAMAQE